MSQENVEAFKRAVDAYNRRDIDTFLEIFDPTAEVHPLNLAMFGREATVYRGHDGLRLFIREVDEVLSEMQAQVLEVRDLGERIVGKGRFRARGRASGAEIEASVGWLVEFKNGRATRMRDYPDFTEALEAAGLSE